LSWAGPVTPESVKTNCVAIHGERQTIQRFWRFSRVALFVAMTGCATVNDMWAQKANGLAQSYPVQPDRAWQIVHAVLDATRAVAIEEHQPDGYLVADTPAFLWGWPTRVAVWIDPEGSGSRVTVRCRLVRPGPFPRALSEEEFHQAFARRVTQLAH
jgi:hypothetical protein